MPTPQVANRDAALELAARARAVFNDGNEVEASRLAHKSHKLHATPDMQDLINHLLQFGAGSPAAREVDRVLRCPAGAHHAVMELARNPPPSSATIKAAYRRLSLLLHPDRNRARGAEEAFKRLGTSFEALSNGQHREQHARPPPPPPRPDRSSAKIEALEQKVRGLESSNEVLRHECKRVVELLNEADKDRATLRKESKRAREAEEKLKAREQRVSAELKCLLELLEKEDRLRDAQVLEMHASARREDRDECWDGLEGPALKVRRVTTMRDLLVSARLGEYDYAFIREGCK